MANRKKSKGRPWRWRSWRWEGKGAGETGKKPEPARRESPNSTGKSTPTKIKRQRPEKSDQKDSIDNTANHQPASNHPANHQTASTDNQPWNHRQQLTNRIKLFIHTTNYNGTQTKLPRESRNDANSPFYRNSWKKEEDR